MLFEVIVGAFAARHAYKAVKKSATGRTPKGRKDAHGRTVQAPPSPCIGTRTGRLDTSLPNLSQVKIVRLSDESVWDEDPRI